ncbi:MAG: hypothetical protein QX199_04755 [Methylococcaceae bacterium]
MKIGFVQTGAIGDIVMALPAAKWYVDRGFDVFWPIDSRYIGFFQRAAPYVNFLSVPASNGYEWHLGIPNQLLASLQVQEIFTLYSYIRNGDQRFDFGQPPFLPDALKLDEYKYAIANVPFAEKWNLVINRNPDGEAKVLESIEAHLPYSIVHDAPAGAGRNIMADIGAEIIGRTVRIQEITDSPFDWIAAFEQAALIACEDSLHANIIEQLNIEVPKYLFLRSRCSHTPVFKNGWKFR